MGVSTIESVYTTAIDSQRDDTQASPTPGRGIEVLIRAAGAHVVGIIEEIRAHALLVIMMRALECGGIASVEFGSESRTGEVTSCRPAGRGFEVCIVFRDAKANNRRLGERFPIVQEGTISADDFESPQSGALVDLSERGMGLITCARLEPKHMVTVQGACMLAFGVVRYTRKLPDGRIHAGIEIFHVMPVQAEERQSHRSVIHRLFQ